MLTYIGETLHISVDSIQKYSNNSKYFHTHMMNRHDQFIKEDMVKDTKNMNKQELRLYNWQMREKQKEFMKSRSVFGGMGALAEDGNGSVGEKSMNTRDKYSKVGGKSDSYYKPTTSHGSDSTSTRGGGGGVKPTSRPNSSSNNNNNNTFRSNNSSSNTISDKSSHKSPADKFKPLNNANKINGNANINSAAKPHTKPNNSIANPITSSTWMLGSGISASCVTETIKNKQTGAIVEAKGKKIVFDDV